MPQEESRLTLMQPRSIAIVYLPEATVKVRIHGRDLDYKSMFDEVMVTPEQAEKWVNSEYCTVTLAPA